MAQKLRLEAEMKDNASPAVKKLRQELSDLQAASADTRGVTKLNAELAKLQSEAAANASPAVRKLRAELAELQKGTAAQQAVAALNREIAALRKQSGDIAPTAGMKAFGGWMGEAKTVAGNFMGTIGGLPGILSAMGIGGIAAGASIAAMASEMRRLGESGLALKEMSRETGLSQQFIASWAGAAQHFQVAKDAAKGMLDVFASQLPDFARGSDASPMFRQLSIYPDVIRKMRADIERGNPAQALQDALDKLEDVGRDRGPQVQKQVAESMFPGHGGDALKMMREGVGGLRKEMAKPWATPSEELNAQAQKLTDATSALNNAIQTFENKAGPAFLKMLTHIVDDMRYILSGPTQAEQKKLDSSEEARRQGFKDLQGDQARRSREAGAKGERDAAPDMSDQHVRDALRHKSSYNGSGFKDLLQNASYTDASPATSQFGVRGLVADGSKEGVLAALREWSLQSDAKGGLGGGGGSTGPGGGGSGGDAGLGSGGRRGFMGHGGRFGGAGDGGGSYDGALPSSSSAGNLTKLIDAEAKRAGIDPRILEGIRAGESGHKDIYDHNGNGEDSWGPFQLNRHGGLGNNFERETAAARKAAGLGGLEDPRTIPMQTRWVAEYIKRHGRGVLGAWHGYHGDRDADPRWRDSGYTPGKDSEVAGASEAFKAAGAGVGAGGGPVDIAKALRGAGEGDAAHALGHYMSHGLWCADFVNGALAKSGGKGTNSSLARSFFSWGKHVGNDGIRKGDVLVSGGHVGFAEGAAQMHNGRMMVPMISGNHGHRVGESWEPLGKYEARRADGPMLAHAPHPLAGRRANGLPTTGRASSERDSNHMLTIDLRDPGGHVKSTRIERNGPLKVDMPNRWQTGRNPLIGA